MTTSTSKAAPFPTWSFDKACSAMEWNTLHTATLSVIVAEDAATLNAFTGTTTEQGSSSPPELIVVGIKAPPAPQHDTGVKPDDEPPLITLTGWAHEIDTAIVQEALSAVANENVKAFQQGAKAGSTTPTVRCGGSKSSRYVLMGLGTARDTEAKLTSEQATTKTTTAFAIGKTIATKCHDEAKVRTCHVVLPRTMVADVQFVQDLTTSLFTTLYHDVRYRSVGSKKRVPHAADLTDIRIFAEPDSSSTPEVVLAEALAVAIDRGRKIALGVIMARDIVNAPHNVLNSESLAETASRLAIESNGRLTCTILGKEECEARGMGAYLGVARGSETEPRFIHIAYKPPADSGEIRTKVGLIGKGVLFDTGGYNIKTSLMESMKFDCGGAAAALGAARAVAALTPPGVEAHFVVAACENMINAKAYVPSDVLTASNGKTIEVLNTDAEGRLTLADALVYADQELNCDKIVELSTLTGSMMVALGMSIAGIFTSNDALALELDEVSKATTDQCWRMPMAKEYNEQLEGSLIADLKNLGGRYGGSITAALFLTHFVSDKKPFAHIDIAGPVWTDAGGATGFGVKLITEWIGRQGEQTEKQP